MPVAQREAGSNTAYKRFRIRPLHKEGSDTGIHDLFFNSIITEFSDTWTPKWSSEDVYGRMDPMPFFSGTGRELTFGFRVVSDDGNEAKKNMVKIQKLIKYQYPSFSSFGNRAGGRTFRFAHIKAPPYFEFEFLNLFNSFGVNTLRGYINGGVQIQPGFQSKEQAQYFSSNFDEIYFSDVTITLRISVIHDPDVFFIESNSRVVETGAQVGAKTPRERYPYGISDDEAANINLALRNSDGTPVDQTQLAGAPPNAGEPASPAPGAPQTLAAAAAQEFERARADAEIPTLLKYHGNAKELAAMLYKFTDTQKKLFNNEIKTTDYNQENQMKFDRKRKNKLHSLGEINISGFPEPGLPPKKKKPFTGIEGVDLFKPARDKPN